MSSLIKLRILLSIRIKFVVVVFYPVLGLTGEACEVCEKVKKLFRDQSGKATLEFIEAVTGELG